MLPTSVRRVVASAPQATSLAQSAIISAPRAATAASTPFIRGHQRRCSSSKPSRSDNGSSGLPAGQSVPSAQRKDTKAEAKAEVKAESKNAGEKRKRKAERDAVKKLPSVPNTHHMVGQNLGLSSFFSLHRPMSVTQVMPKGVTDEHFASIFATPSKSKHVSDTMSTISTTIDQLEGPMASVTIDAQQDNYHTSNDGMHRMEFRNSDGSESSIYLQVDAMSGDFLPFRPPPIPQPQPNMDSANASENAVSEASSEDAPAHRAYKAMFTIEETTEPDGQIRIVAHSPHIMQDHEEQQPRSFLERMAQRQVKFDEARGERDMYGISVKRQRKLRMKKKKYKKLMRRTRNERRNLGRT